MYYSEQLGALYLKKKKPSSTEKRTVWKKNLKLPKKPICDALRDLVQFVQFKKREKHPWRSVNFSKVAEWYQIEQRTTYLHLLSDSSFCLINNKSLIGLLSRYNLPVFLVAQNSPFSSTFCLFPPDMPYRQKLLFSSANLQTSDFIFCLCNLLSFYVLRPSTTSYHFIQSFFLFPIFSIPFCNFRS